MPLIISGVTSETPNVSDKFIPALVVVDMQTDFISGSLAVPDAASIIEPINSMLSLPFALKVGTKDFHPPKHISFASTHNKSIGDRITIYRPDSSDSKSDAGIDQVLWPDHCVQSTPGCEFVEGLNSSAFDAVVHKGTHPKVECYSAFGDPWGVTAMELPSLLSAKGVTDVFVVGLAGDYCVKSTAIDAVKYGSKTGSRTWVVEDLVRSVGNEGTEWDEMRKAGVMVIGSDSVKARLENKLL
jgi:nicotinamidase